VEKLLTSQADMMAQLAVLFLSKIDWNFGYKIWVIIENCECFRRLAKEANRTEVYAFEWQRQPSSS